MNQSIVWPNIKTRLIIALRCAIETIVRAVILAAATIGILAAAAPWIPGRGTNPILDAIQAEPVAIVAATLIAAGIGFLASHAIVRRWAVGTIVKGVEHWMQPFAEKLQAIEQIARSLASLAPCPWCGFLTPYGGLCDGVEYTCPDCGERSRWERMQRSIPATGGDENTPATPPRVMQRYHLVAVERNEAAEEANIRDQVERLADRVKRVESLYQGKTGRSHA